jgi:outer membrane receptor for ferrienterochelin and colicins
MAYLLIYTVIMNNVTIKTVFPVCLCLFSAVSIAIKTEDLFDLSLEELNNLNVSVSSNYQQSIRTSPGIVRIIDKEMINRNGWNNLQQVLMHVPGIQISISKNGHSNIWMRGVQNRNNNKVLLLVDGVPQHDHYYGNFHINNQLPIKHIEKIEILNGPGGVVHGANSFSGVISITTLSSGNQLGAAISQQNSYASSGSNETTYGYELYADNDWVSEIGNFYLFASNLDNKGFQPQYNREGEFYDRDTRIESNYLLGKYSNNDLNIQFSYSDYKYPYLYTKADRWQGYDKQFFTTSANYEYYVNTALKLKLSAFYKDYDFSRPKIFYDGNRVEASGQSLHDTAAEGLDATILWPISDERHVSFGVSYTRDWAQDTFEENTDFPLNATPVTTKVLSLIEDTSRHVLGLFSEYQQQVLTDHWLHLGLRYDQLSDFEDQSSYRISLTRETNDFYHKILLGTSYRVPSYREYLKKYNANYTQKNPLQPEQMQTFELAFGFTPENHEVLLVLYVNRYQDFIKEVSINSVNGTSIDSGDGDEYGFNFDEIDISGLELSWNWIMSDDIIINSSVAHILEATEDPGVLTSSVVSPSPISSEQSDVPFLSDITASIQINYTLNNANSIYWDAIYYSDRPYPSNYQADSLIKATDNSNGFWQSNITMRSTLKEDLTIGLGINNIFNSNIYSPNLDPASDYDNQWPKRHIELTVQWQH